MLLILLLPFGLFISIKPTQKLENPKSKIGTVIDNSKQKKKKIKKN